MVHWMLLAALAAEVPPLLEQAKQSKSESFVVWQGGRPVLSYQPGRRTLVQSVTKPFVSLGAGCLAGEGKLPPLETKLSEILPELREDPKGSVTLRHLMGHTSGIADGKDENGRNLKEFNAAPDHWAYALKRPMQEAPGTKFRYNNVGVVLAGTAVSRLAGEPLPELVRRCLFRPLGIRTDEWRKNGTKQDFYFTGLVISGEDLAKIGQLVLQRGRWEGKQLIPEEWMRQSTEVASFPSASATVGLLWFFQPPRAPGERPVLIFHTGDGGTVLYIYPEVEGVVVRLRSMQKGDDPFFDRLATAAYTFLREMAAAGKKPAAGASP
jgi:CubicO group peptidase (beta-lactamase class C family)